MRHTYTAGIDIGSTTVKLVVLDEEKNDSANSLAFFSPTGAAERHKAMNNNGINNIFFIIVQFRS